MAFFWMSAAAVTNGQSGSAGGSIIREQQDGVPITVAAGTVTNFGTITATGGTASF